MAIEGVLENDPKSDRTTTAGDYSPSGESSVVSLAGRRFAVVPPELFDRAETLEVLDLSGNAISSLPDDFARFTKLRVLFCSGNPFVRLPPVLGACKALTQIGFRGCGLREIPAESLPPGLRWLTLTDNAIDTLPATLGERPLLQKLMLAGNRLSRLPDGLATASHLELIRLSANAFKTLPSWLFDLPRLAWAALAGNPMDGGRPNAAVTRVDWSAIRQGALLGEGASGHVHHALWSPAGGVERAVALKLFKGAMTSDGLPAREMDACLAAGDHPNIIGTLGRLDGHPEHREGLLMPLLSANWRVLAGAPSLESCSRDIYDPDLRFDPAVALRIARDVAAATAHLHARDLMHGDLYAHNSLWDGRTGAAVLSDFGAASFMPRENARACGSMDVLAWGILLGELLDRCPEISDTGSPTRRLQNDCMGNIPLERPTMSTALRLIEGMLRC